MCVCVCVYIYIYIYIFLNINLLKNPIKISTFLEPWCDNSFLFFFFSFLNQLKLCLSFASDVRACVC